MTNEGSQGCDEYVVERVIDMRVRRGIKEYLLKWKGYPKLVIIYNFTYHVYACSSLDGYTSLSRDESTWEPEDSLHCDILVDEFESVQRDRSEADDRLVYQTRQVCTVKVDRLTRNHNITKYVIYRISEFADSR